MFSSINQVEEILQNAVSHHQSGALKQAEEQYQRILKIDPQNSDALHLLGTIAHHMGNFKKASILIDKAIENEPDFPNYFISRGDVYSDQGNFKQAISCYQKALELNPNLSEAHFNLGNTYYRMKEYVSAISSYENALKINPDFPEAHNNQGLAYHSQGKFKKAVNCFKQALRIKPDYADAHNNLGNSLHDDGRIVEAIKSYQKVIGLDTNHFEAIYNLGNAFHELKDFDQAFSCYHKALSIRPDYADTYVNLGKTYHLKGKYDQAVSCYKKAAAVNPDIPNLYFYMGNAFLDHYRIDEAISCYKKVIARNPNFSDAYINMGNAYHNQDKFHEAVSCYKKALKVAPGDAKAFNNLGKTFREQVKLKEAILCYKTALELKPDYAEAHENYALVLLLSGNFDMGWKEYEWRLLEKEVPLSSCPQPNWDGSSLSDKALLIYAEQGIGDEIMFASCLADVMNRADNCLVECDKRLMPLFERSFPGIKPFPRENHSRSLSTDLSPPVVKIALGSLPRYFRTKLEDFPQRKYLFTDREKMEFWRQQFLKLGLGQKIGISWRAGKRTNTGRIRSVELKHWHELFSIPDAHFINLQYGNTKEELVKINKILGVTIHDWEEIDPLTDMDEFAAQISALDLVISVDNSTVHLAGALGVPVWTLLPYAPDWRWMLNTEGSYWYPTMTLFRQSSPGNWGGVFKKVKRALEEFIDQSRTILHTAKFL